MKMSTKPVLRGVARTITGLYCKHQSTQTLPCFNLLWELFAQKWMHSVSGWAYLWVYTNTVLATTQLQHSLIAPITIVSNKANNITSVPLWLVIYILQETKKKPNKKTKSQRKSVIATQLTHAVDGKCRALSNRLMSYHREYQS